MYAQRKPCSKSYGRSKVDPSSAQGRQLYSTPGLAFLRHSIGKF